jgi:RNA polymerase sigma-70 factor (ECF subfamily)
MDELKLINDILKGHKDDYRILMDRYYKELFKYIYNMVGSYETTEDLLQEIFLKVYHKLNRFDGSKASFRTWIYRVSANHTYNFLKKKSNQFNQYTYEYDDAINKADVDVEKEAIKSDQINRVILAMKKVLKPKHYKIISLHYFSNLTPKEISESTNIPLKTVYKAIKSGIERIKKEVEHDENES